MNIRICVFHLLWVLRWLLIVPRFHNSCFSSWIASHNYFLRITVAKCEAVVLIQILSWERSKLNDYIIRNWLLIRVLIRLNFHVVIITGPFNSIFFDINEIIPVTRGIYSIPLRCRSWCLCNCYFGNWTIRRVRWFEWINYSAPLWITDC